MQISRATLVILATLGVALVSNSRISRADDKLEHKFENEIRAFEAADAKNPPPQHAILFIGSSGIRLWKSLAEDFPKHKVINRGFGGSEIADSVYFADRIVIPYKPSMIVLRAGTNDIQDGKTPEEVADSLRAFVEKVRASLPDTPIVFLSINPSIARWKNIDKERRANELIQAFIGTQQNMEFVDIGTAMLGPDGKPRSELYIFDGLHPSRAGYQLWTSIVTPHLPAPKSQ